MRILSSRIGWAFVAVHWVLYAVAMWQRGGLDQPFHAVYEPWLMLVLLLGDVFWFVVVGVFVPNDTNSPGLFLILIGFVAAIQWYWIGYAVERRAVNKRLV